MKKRTIIELARELRKQQTLEEKKLWSILRNRNLEGFKFNRQHPIVYKQSQYQYLFFIADFYCAEKKLVIELDGPIHEHTKYYDYQRDLILKEKGLQVLRFKNEELDNPGIVKHRVLQFLRKRENPKIK